MATHVTAGGTEKCRSAFIGILIALVVALLGTDVTAPWHDRRVRLAANLAIDKQTISEALGSGLDRPTGSIIPRALAFALPLDPFPYDAVQAKRLLAEAGYPQGFHASDVIFTWEYAADPATATTTAGSYRDIAHVERLGDHAVKLVFKGPTPFWADAICSNAGMILPRHVFAPYRGQQSREAPANLIPIGTGPYRHVDFKPGDVLRAEINPGYHVPNRPFFDAIELKGGGDAVSAARAVLQTGQYDYAWGLGSIEDAVLHDRGFGGERFVPTFSPVSLPLIISALTGLEATDDLSLIGVDVFANKDRLGGELTCECRG